MEQILLGLVLFNAFFQPSDFQYDTFELGQIQMKENSESSLVFDNSLKKIEGGSLGSREYDQANSWFRYGHATYIYCQKFESEDGKQKLRQYGGYAGFLAEINYKRYFGIGIIAGGGATYTEFTNTSVKDKDRSNYFGLASPYVTIGLPITNTGSINLTASTYYLSDPAEQIDGAKEGFETPRNFRK
jgi:hypothetical protein